MQGKILALLYQAATFFMVILSLEFSSSVNLPFFLTVESILLKTTMAIRVVINWHSRHTTVIVGTVQT